MGALARSGDGTDDSRPPRRSLMYWAKPGLENSPSLGMSMPTSACLRTTSFTPCRTADSNVCSSYGLWLTLLRMICRISGGRTRLPTCVVRMRWLLRFTVSGNLAAQECPEYSNGYGAEWLAR